MSRSFALRMTFLGILCMICTTVFAQQFSATLVSAEKGEQKPPSKFYISNTKVRIEPQGQNNVVIVDNSTQMMDVLLPAQHTYIETKITQAGPRANQLGLLAFHTNDVENACDDLQKIRSKPGTCHKVGDESVDGRSAVRYEGVSGDGYAGKIWVDKNLKYPIKWDDENGTGEFQNIDDSSPSASLFEIPAGYQKMDNSMMGGHH